MNFFNEGPRITDDSISGRILKKAAAESRFGNVGKGAYDQVHSERFGAGLEQGKRLGMASFRDKEEGSPLEIMAHRHRLSGSGGLIEHRGVGNRHSGQIADHGLEVHQRLHAPLRDLRLIGCVGRVPTGILENIPADHRREMRSVIPHADVGGTDFVQ